MSGEAQSSGARVLAIDDTLDNLITLRAVLEDALPGCVLLTATDGASGLELARVEDPDVVLLDIIMPGMDGFEVCTRMKADEALRDIPVVFLTAMGTGRKARVEALRVGAEGFLSKPPDEMELVAQIGAMARLKAASRDRRLQMDELEARVQERTRQLRQELEERRKVEADRELLATAIEQSAETVFVTDPQGRIIYANPAFEEVSGYTVAEAVGANPRILGSGLHAPASFDELWSTVASGRTWSGRIVNRRKDGQLYTEDVTISPVRDRSGRIANYVAVKKDVTRSLEIESQLLQAQKMESVGRLAGGVAHDFNNILAVILSSVRFAIEAVPAEGELRSDLLEIESAGERAAALTRQLLAFSRKQMLAPEVLDLNGLVRSLEKMLRRVVGEDVNLVPDLAPERLLVRADPVQIQQVIVNLVVNARDAMPGGGTLTIRTRNAEGPSQVQLQISDTGTGMDEATMACLFEPFFTTKEAGKGTGLGLSSAYGIVRQSGGSIRATSQPGKGTTIEVMLPRTEEDAGQAAAGPSAGDLAGTETVLVVEDDASVRGAVRRMLAKAGYAVLVAENGLEGLARCREHEGDIHLVLADVVMPTMNGQAFRERLHQERPATRVLLMSGYTDEKLCSNGVLASDVGFIAKPFNVETLLQRVRQVLDAIYSQ